MQQKWKVLSKELVASGVYHAERLRPELLSRRYYSGHAAMKETCEVIGTRTIKAYGALWPTWHPHRWEIGTLYVREEYRGNGLLPGILKELIQRAPEHSELFFITKEERVMRLGPEFGFVRISETVHPSILRWASEVGVVCRLPSSVHRIGWPSAKPGERWLFMRKAQ